MGVVSRFTHQTSTSFGIHAGEAAFIFILPHADFLCRGRAQETFGEDPLLMARLVVKMVTGAQNNSVGSEVGPDGKRLRVGLCCKHFAVYNGNNFVRIE